MAEKENRGTIAFFSTNRPPLPLDLYSSPISPQPSSNRVELCLTDGSSYNYNGQSIPKNALNHILNSTHLGSSSIASATESDIDLGRITGIVFVSERTDNLETIHFGIRFDDKVWVFNFAEIYGTFNGVRMEDSPCFLGDDYLVYVSTKDPAVYPRQPWTAVYKTHLRNGETRRITPPGFADLNPSVSPCGNKIAVASFESKGDCDGEVEELKSDIFVVDAEEPFHRELVVKNGGWPSWGSEKVLFFHRKEGDFWGVFRVEFSINGGVSECFRVTPEGVNAVTPAAIDSTKVAVTTSVDVCGDGGDEQYQHIEIFDVNRDNQSTPVTSRIEPEADHFNPFVIVGNNGEIHVGYHRCRIEFDHESGFEALQIVPSPDPDVGLFRTSTVFPTFSKDGTKLAFVDSEFNAVWLANDRGSRLIYEMDGSEVLSLAWNQNSENDILYICTGSSVDADKPMHIIAIFDASSDSQQFRRLTKDYNNAFPSSNPEGTRLVFRSTRAGAKEGYKNLYIMDALVGEYGSGSNRVTRLTEGNWIDTHCQWSPRGDWIVFSSTRGKPQGVPSNANELNPRYFAVFLVKENDPSVVVRVIGSGSDLSGHVNHPFFSPDAMSIVVVSDLAAVSVDPISMPLCSRGGDIFVIAIDPNDISKNRDVKYNRITHSRYENSIGTWTMFSTNIDWNQLLSKPRIL